MDNFLKKITSSKEAAREYLIKAGIFTAEEFEENDRNINLKKETIDRFPYVVASLWRQQYPVDWENLRIYTYGGDVLFGSIEDANGFLGYVKRQKHYDNTSYDSDPEGNPWKIYKI